MMEESLWWNLLLAYGTYFIGVVTPGPSNLVIMEKSLHYGRKEGLATAWGISFGSFSWGIFSAFGFSVLLLKYPAVLNLFGLIGSGYFGLLAWQAFYRAFYMAQQENLPLSTQCTEVGTEVVSKFNFWSFFLQGLGLHLTNPKVCFVWVSIITFGLPQGSSSSLLPLLIVLGCGVLGFFLFSAMAIMFSNPKMAKLYHQHGSIINGCIALFFFMAASSLLYRSLQVLFF